MSYLDRADLVGDPTFMSRLSACVGNEASTRPEDDFTNLILRSPLDFGGQVFSTSVVSQPGFDVANDQITDGMLLAAVQASWERVAALYP